MIRCWYNKQEYRLLQVLSLEPPHVALLAPDGTPISVPLGAVTFETAKAPVVIPEEPRLQGAKKILHKR